MRSFQAASARATPGDRNPATIGTVSVVTAVAPHGATQRILYTVPANRKCLITAFQVYFERLTVAAPVGQVEYYVRINAAAAVNVRLSQITALTNNIGDFRQQSNSPQLNLLATESISTVSSDASTGGTGFYSAGFAGTEYDA